MGRNRGLITYRRSQSNLPRTHREQGGQEQHKKSRTALRREARFRAAQHLEDAGVIQPHAARGRPPIVELEERDRGYARALLEPRILSGRSAFSSPRATRRALNRTSLELGFTYLAASAIGLWCTLLIVTGGHHTAWKLVGGAVAPVFLWAGGHMLRALELPPGEVDPRAHAPARQALRVSLAALSVLALLVATG